MMETQDNHPSVHKTKSFENKPLNEQFSGFEMESASGLRGTLVVTKQEGSQLGQIAKIYFHPETKKISGVSLRKNLIGEDFFVDVENIDFIGEDVIFVQNKEAVKPISEMNKPTGNSLKDLQGSWVTTLGGDHVGILVDVEIHPKEWVISELLLSESRRLSIEPAEVTMGQDEVLVPGNYADKVKESDASKRGFIARTFGQEIFDDLSNTIARTVKRMKRSFLNKSTN